MIIIIKNDNNNDLIIINNNDTITNTEIFVFIPVLVFKSLSHQILFINRKGNGNC